MAILAPLLLKQRVALMKAETTTGTAASLTSSEGAYNVFDPNLQPQIDYAERQGQVSLSYLPGIAGARKGKFTLKTELFGSGDNANPTPAWTGTLLAACGFTTATNVSSPVTGSSSYVSLTMGLNTDGRLKSIAGATGTGKLSGTVGRPAMWEWDFDGVWQAPTATAIVTPTFPTTLPPIVSGITFTIGGTAYRVSSFELDLGVTVAYREDASNAAGYLATVPSDRKPGFKCTIESVALGTHDFYADYVSNQARAISLAIGSTAGNICTIAMGAAQLRSSPQDGDKEGVLVDNLDYQLTRVANAGDDEVTLTWS